MNRGLKRFPATQGSNTVNRNILLMDNLVSSFETTKGPERGPFVIGEIRLIIVWIQVAGFVCQVYQLSHTCCAKFMEKIILDPANRLTGWVA